MKKEGIKIKGHLKLTFRDGQTKEVKRITEYDNLICTVGNTMIANNLSDASPDNTMKVNYVALGSDDTAPAIGDTALGTETYRNTVSSSSNVLNVAYFTGFFNTTETTGTYKEAGLFSNGGAGADSGILLSHVAIDVTKDNTETLTIDWTLTIT